jgi:hypothetical protein
MMWKFSLSGHNAHDMMVIPKHKHKGESVKKTHLLTKPTRLQDINFDDLDDGIDSRWSARAEKSRIKNYRRMRNQES